MAVHDENWVGKLRIGIAVLFFFLALPVHPATAQCCGDCNTDGQVTVNELVIAVNYALGGCGGEGCCGDCLATGEVTITDLVTAVDHALGSCPSTPPGGGDALCAPGETLFTFAIAASGDDGAVTAFSASPYPPTDLNVQDDQSAGSPYRSKLASNFSIQVNLFRWTTSFPADRAVTAAYLRFFTPTYLVNVDTDNRNLTADWYDWSDNGGVDPADYAENAKTNALAGHRIGLLGESGAWNVVRLDNADGVARDGTTHLRLHVSGGEPTAINGIGIEHWDDARDHPAELIVCQPG